MKKIVVVLLLVGAGGFVYYKFLTPEKRSCGKLASLCGAEVSGEKCEDGLVDLKKGIGDDGAAKLHDCVGKAQSCAEATGCMVGAGVSGAADAVGKFMKRLGEALKK